MVPHLTYIDPLSSYYYFRPYQAFHVREHQNEVVTYGGDPRNPYANRLFDNLYAELEASWAKEEAAQVGSPFEDEVSPEQKEEAEAPEPPKVKPPTPNFNTSTTPASRLRAVLREAKPIQPTALKSENTASASNAQRGVFRVKK